MSLSVVHTSCFQCNALRFGAMQGGGANSTGYRLHNRPPKLARKEEASYVPPNSIPFEDRAARTWTFNLQPLPLPLNSEFRQARCSTTARRRGPANGWPMSCRSSFSSTELTTPRTISRTASRTPTRTYRGTSTGERDNGGGGNPRAP